MYAFSKWIGSKNQPNNLNIDSSSEKLISKSSESDEDSPNKITPISKSSESDEDSPNEITPISKSSESDEDSPNEITPNSTKDFPNLNVAVTESTIPQIQGATNFSAPQLQSKPVWKYKKQFVLDLGSGSSARGLKARASHKYGLETHIIDLKTPNPDLTKLEALDNQSRIYIVGHCYPNWDYIMSDSSKTVKAKEYANIIANSYKKTNKPGTLKISLVACFAGGGNQELLDKCAENGDIKPEINPIFSFAYKLGDELQRKGIECYIHGRTAPVSRFDLENNEPKDYKKTTFHKNPQSNGFQEPGSKNVFIVRNETTIRISSHVWRTKK